MSIIDEAHIERKISMDIDVSKLTKVAEHSGLRHEPRIMLPLAVLTKKLHLDFDVSDASGTPLHLFTSTKNSELARSLITAALHEQEFSPSTIERVHERLSTVTGFPTHERDQVKFLLHRLELLLTSEEFTALNGNHEIISLIRTFAENYLAIVELPFNPIEPVITVKYRFVESWQLWKPRLKERLGLSTLRLAFPSEIGNAHSNHQIFRAPAGLLLNAAVTTTDQPPNTHHTVHSRPTVSERTTPTTYVLYAQARQLQRTESLISASPSLNSFYWPALFTTLMSLGLMTAGLFLEFRMATLSTVSDSNSLATVLLIIPSIANVYLFFSGEHAMLSRLLALPRFLVFVSAIGPVIAAAALALHAERDVLLWIFSIATAITLTVAVVIGSTSITSWKRQRQIFGE